MSKQYIDVFNKLLQNVTGKTVTGNYQELADLIDAYNDKYLCEVTFSTTPAGATIVVKDSGGNTISAKEGKYYLNEGSYTYDASAEGYVSKTGQSLVITNADEQTGTKTVTVTLTAEVSG